ncbi:MAG: prepilin-type N-terminal cleavage/methylation domain-containing protein [Puniceicoccales bacterium]|jgi:type II secretory pathway pseudopilin PulG|nr:prepilin-type N-terminal cleavage/methylation domain-containing protein [Puniceicoccales bacterium]
MARHRHSPHQRSRAAFTLVELLTVLGIIMLLGAAIVALQPGNPQGLAAAQSTAISVFGTAQLRAVQASNPDRDPDKNPLHNLRARVLILNDPTQPELHLRQMRIVVGGTRTTSTTDPCQWYTTEPDTMLPQGIYMVPPNDSSLRSSHRSHITNKDTPTTTMRINKEPSLVAQPDGAGDREWYFYEFNDDGTSNMNFATFMLSEGEWDPGAKQVRFRNEQNIAGFWITPAGKTVSYTDTDEITLQGNPK